MGRGIVLGGAALQGSSPEERLGEEHGQAHQELWEWEERVTAKAVSQWEANERGQQELEREEDERCHELSLRTDVRAPEDSQWDDVRELAQREERVSSQELSPWGPDISSKIWDRALSPVSEEEPQPCPPEGPGSASPVGTAVAAEAAPALPSASPAPGSATEAEPAAAAPAGAAEEEEPQSPPSVPFNSPASSQASAYQEQNITGDMLSQALLELLELRQQREEEYALQQWMAVEATGTAQGEESPVPAPHSSPSPSPAPLGAQALREQQEGTAAGSVLAVQERMEDSDEEMKYWQFLDDLEPFLVRDPELSEGEGEEEAELSLGEINNSQEMSQGKECPEQETSQEVSDWEEHLEQGLSQGDVNSCEELSDWEEHIGQDLSQGETCIGQDVSRGNGSRPSAQSSWEDDSDKELVQEIWEEETEHGIGTKPLQPEDDEWDELGVLELPPEEQNRGGFAALGLPVPVPREAWVEGPAPEPCSPGPLCASPAALQGRGPVGHAASPALEEPGPEAGTESPVPAPRKRPSRFRRALQALRGLFRCPCLAPQPED
ncbi:MAP7 domain-containing protein 1-like [Corvus cornix cornix]|uniref:MAP7 domain-containing protein 1-like n=1 Tax=Corvus cornix cornix TaxID=932674 RepID=UPI0019528AE4|nr:MAP7 domain-containing protein 1-like [Corvus cornix cornix]